MQSLLASLLLLCSSYSAAQDDGAKSTAIGHLFEVDDAIALLEPGAEEPKLLLEFSQGGRNGLSFDPEGQRFAFASNHERDWRVYVGDRSGLSRRAGGDSEPGFHFVLDTRWAPRGEWIAYEGMGKEVGTGGVALVHGATGQRRPVTPAGEHDSSFAWFPDGKRLAVGHTISSEVKSEGHTIWVERRSALEIHPIDGGERTRIVDLESELDQLAVAPDGKHALFIASGSLWYVELKAGAEPERLQEKVGNHVAPVFAPGSSNGQQRYAFVRRVPRDGGSKTDDAPIVATLGGEADELVFQPRTLVAYMHWSPDGSRLALTDFFGVHVLGLDGSETALPLGEREVGYMSALDWR